MTDTETQPADEEPVVLTYEGDLIVAFDDDPRTLILEIADNNEEEDGTFVRLHSWSGIGEHETFEKLRGKKVLVTVEVVDD